MALKFNSGRGAVICDECRIIIDTGIGPEEYKEAYGDGPDICWRCKDPICKACKDVCWLMPLSYDESGVPCPHCNPDGKKGIDENRNNRRQPHSDPGGLGAAGEADDVRDEQ